MEIRADRRMENGVEGAEMLLVKVSAVLVVDCQFVGAGDGV